LFPRFSSKREGDSYLSPNDPMTAPFIHVVEEAAWCDRKRWQIDASPGKTMNMGDELVSPSDAQLISGTGDDAKTPSSTKATEPTEDLTLRHREDQIRGHLQSGDVKRATAIAIHLYGAELYSFICGILDEQDAGDANAELWEGVIRSLPGFHWSSSFKTWSYKIARNTCNRFLRDRYRQRQERPLSDSPELAALEAKVRTETAPYLRSDFHDQIRQIRAALPAEDRMILMLHVDRQLPWGEVARIMLDVAEPSKQDMARLRKRFQRIKEEIVAKAKELGLLEKT
jgi:RNA polymerase sigma-70 factor, ECF subfamily